MQRSRLGNVRERLRCLFDRAMAFVTAPASARPLGVFRIGIAAVLLAQAVTLAPHVLDLFGELGIMQRPLIDATVLPGLPRVGWLSDLLATWGIDDAGTACGLFLAYVASLTCLLIGWRTRLAASGAFLTHLMLKTSGIASTYGIDAFATITLFYCVVLPVGRALSVDVGTGRVSGAPTPLARLALRVLQVHLCVVYLTSGLEKASSPQWWNGEAIWRAAMRPDLGQFDFSWLASVPWLAQLFGWGTLAVEIGYAGFIWPTWTRRPWALATIGLHLGIAVSMGLGFFSAMMALLTASAFLISPEPLRQPRPARGELADSRLSVLPNTKLELQI